MILDPSWVARRVETLTYIDASTAERRITLDIDGAHLKSISDRLLTIIPSQVLIPVAELPKQLILSMDLRDASGAALAMATSEIDSWASVSVLLAELEQHGIVCANLPDSILTAMKHACYCTPSDTDIANLISGSGEVSAWSLPDGEVKDGDESFWQKLIADIAEFRALLQYFTLNFMPMVRISNKSDITIIKFRLVSRIEQPNHGLWRWTSIVYCPAVGKAARAHMRILPPPGLGIQYLRLVHIVAGSSSGALVPARDQTGEPEYEFRREIDRGVIYGRLLPARKYAVIMSMRPLSSGFINQSFWALMATLTLMVTSSAVATWRPASDVFPASIEGVIILVALLPSLMLGMLARDGEHEITNRLLRGPRVLLATASVSVMLAGLGLATGFHGGSLSWIWWIATTVVGVITLIMGGLKGSAKKNERQIRSDERLAIAARVVKLES